MSLKKKTVIYQSKENRFPGQNEPFITKDDDFDNVKSHLGWSLVNSLCCTCTGIGVLFFSIPASIFSCRARDSIKDGDYYQATKNSMYAKILNILATILVIISLVALAVILILYGAGLWNTVKHVQVAMNQKDAAFYDVFKNILMNNSTKTD